MSTRMAMTMAAGLLLTGFGPHSAAGDKDDAVKKDMKLLEGTWHMESFEINGKPLPAEKVKSIKVTIKGDRYSVDLGEKSFELTFKIDPTKKPKAIDLTMAMGDEKAVTHGIYEVSADTFKICRTTEAGKDRPTAFAGKEGMAYAVYKRKK
jgi:uncharacterized protein (TIGR03067 family)